VNYNSFTFWLFFALVYGLYWRFSHRGQNRVMLAASYVFYGFWDYRFLYLILISTVIDFVGGLGVAGVRIPPRRLVGLGALLVVSAFALGSGVRYEALGEALRAGDVAGALGAFSGRIDDYAVGLGTFAAVAAYGAVLPWLYRLPEARRRKTFLVISMAANLVILGFFKYFDFFVGSFADLLHAMGFQASPQTLGILLPAGISFYTFQAMSYTVDIYRGEAAPTEDFLDFALFVCFFPHLVAGPIMRAHTLLPQVVSPRVRKDGDVRDGVALIVIGLFKKIVIADNMAMVANSVFFRVQDGAAAGLTGPEVWIGVYAFAFQIYGDFSGYSAIARGISKLFGYELVVNFDLPYVAQSPSDFWKRWHISLSSWLRDYLYIPLGGNRGSTARLYRNLMLTMLLGGLWHGSSWTFVAWGLYHGLLLCTFRLLRIPDVVPADAPYAAARRLGRIVFMFHLTCLGWLLFRAASFGDVVQMAALMFGDLRWSPSVVPAAAVMLFWAGPLFAVELLLRGERRIDRVFGVPVVARTAALAYASVMILYFHAEKAVEFIYFQF
jgi:D-alanyl-lipoteichoic acid acyltransferase DltB (MBOAT superfamily)